MQISCQLQQHWNVQRNMLKRLDNLGINLACKVKSCAVWSQGRMYTYNGATPPRAAHTSQRIVQWIAPSCQIEPLCIWMCNSASDRGCIYAPGLLSRSPSRASCKITPPSSRAPRNLCSVVCRINHTRPTINKPERALSLSQSCTRGMRVDISQLLFAIVNIWKSVGSSARERDSRLGMGKLIDF